MKKVAHEGPGRLQGQAERLTRLLSEVQTCCQGRMLHQSQRFDMPPALIKCLMLFAVEPYLTVSRAARELEVAPSRASKILEGLEKKGLCQRRQAPNDARVKLAGLTRAGKAKMRELGDYSAFLHREILKGLPPGRRGDALRVLEDLLASMEALKGNLAS